MSIELRNTIFNEVERILHGPIGGTGEELDKNPLDFYTVGILFPRIGPVRYFNDDHDIIPNDVEGLQDDHDSGVAGVDLESESLKKRRLKLESNEVISNDELELATKFRPSAAGVSVLVQKRSSLKVNVSFAVYEKKTADRISSSDHQKNIKTTVYKHIPVQFEFLSNDEKFDFGGLDYTEETNITYVDLGCNGCLSIVTRPYRYKPDLKYQESNLEIKTFTIINNTEATTSGNQRNVEQCIFQPLISIVSNYGFEPFKDLTDLRVLSNEDLNLKLLYRNYQSYGMGHGISVDWHLINGRVNIVETKVLPKEEVNGVNLNPEVFKKSDILYMKELSGQLTGGVSEWENVKKRLIEFKKSYFHWIVEQEKLISDNNEELQSQLIETANKNLAQCKKFYSRMKSGIEILDQNAIVRKAFGDANQAMFNQRVMADFSKHRRNEERVQSSTSDNDDALPDFNLIPSDASSGVIWKNGILDLSDIENKKNGSLARWRPFQLAFLLSQLEGIIDPESEDRDTVDLIWFPTGGGKTEAYLGLTAFTIFYRRLIAKEKKGNPDIGAGVSVLMRYTLRLLNKQQFERASILICACDLIRRKDPENYGFKRISNGIWMGRSMTPNRVDDQVNDYAYYIRQINKGGVSDSFKSSPPLLSCPCCGNRLIKEVNGKEAIGRWGYFRIKSIKNVESGPYLIGCTNTKCDYHVTASTYKNKKENNLPVYEVDEVIYQERPSLLFSTVDKFVQLAWNSDCFNIFNIEFNHGQLNRLYSPPDLIIQDELHLISSALGTIYGVYEIVIDRLCKEAGGSMSKVVGASATVRNAAEQCKRLYARTNFSQFPPPGISADDSFYAKKIEGIDLKNRLYIGFMPSGLTTSTALIRLTSVLLERIPALLETNQNLDKYYTLVVYFNALKELGKFRTFLTDDIVAYRKLLANHFKTFIKPFNNNSLCELSSVMTADEITNGLDRLEKVTLPMGADIDNPLIKALFESGIRSLLSLKTAKGSLWSEKFVNEDFFKTIGLHYTGDKSADFKNFMMTVKKSMDDKAEPIHIAPATNMISVGVDIPRLNTMIVNGQPKTTAEYIQASSRVGREFPGVVFTFLSPTKNRDRSHYEQFKSFHQAYYYYVESNSVTPFSRPALEKVLPTVLIALTRSLFLKGEKKHVFSGDGLEYKEFVSGILKEISIRGMAIYDSKQHAEINSIITQIQHDFFKSLSSLIGDRRLAEYGDYLQKDSSTGMWVPVRHKHIAVYNAPSQFVDNLLSHHIPTMQTLRNVESSTAVLIKR